MRTKLIPAALLILGLQMVSIPALRAATVSVREVAADIQYPEGAEQGAIKFVCAESEDLLREVFQAEGRPFESSLVRKAGGERCHIWYEPTLEGFRADPDDSQVKALMFDVDTLSFLSGRTEVVGDSLDVVKQILPHIERPLEIILGVNSSLEDEWYEGALKQHFKALPHNVSFQETTATLTNPWVQDYVKSGKVGEDSVALVPRRLLEGSAEYGEKYTAFLDELDGSFFVRSRLSWEGGDLQFLSHPANPEETIIFYGDTAKNYWGKEISKEEYAYILKMEFGADHAVDLSGLAPHIDYFVSFIPESGIALVSEPITGSQALAYSALETLGQRLKSPYTNEIMKMAQSLSVGVLEFRKSRSEIRKAIDKLKESQGQLEIEEKLGMQERLEAYIRENCSEDPERCFSGPRQQKMFEEDLPLLRDMVASAAVMRSDMAQIPVLLSVIESQLPDYEIPDTELRRRKIAELEALGLKVITVPRIAGDKSLNVPWSGISYVNNLLIDDCLFIPVMGMKEIERLFVEDLNIQLNNKYKVVPVYARDLILNNGGIHCATGIIRGR